MSVLRAGPDVHREDRDLIEDLSEKYTIAVVTHNISRPRHLDQVAFFLMGS